VRLFHRSLEFPCVVVRRAIVRHCRLDGFWLSEGYGTLLKIDGERVQVFEVTSISCLPAWSGSRRPGDGGIEAVLQKDNSSIRLVVTQAESPDARCIGFPDTTSPMRFHRRDRPPETFG
jgi:hypothetical protein